MTEYLNETVFTWGGTPLKFGVGASDEIGYDLAQLGVYRALLIADPGVAASGVPQRVADAAKDGGLVVEIYDQVHVEPTDQSIHDAVEFAGKDSWDGFIGVGGGSSIDTARALNMLTTYPSDLFDYVNKPIAKGHAGRAAQTDDRGPDDRWYGLGDDAGMHHGLPQAQGGVRDQPRAPATDQCRH